MADAASRSRSLLWGAAFACLNALLALSVWGLGGCGRVAGESGLVLVTPHVDAPTILSSEADQIAIGARVDAPLTFENRSSREQSISVGKTGCSCYGIATKQFLLDAGERVKIPPGGTKDLYFVAREIEGETEQTFRVRFNVGGAVEASPAAVDDGITATGSMKIVRDLTLEPASLVVDLPSPGSSASRQSEFPISLRQVTRGRRQISAPKFVMMPGLLKAQAFKAAGEPTEIAPGLWQTDWTSSLSLLELPESVRENGGRFVFSVEFEELQPGVVDAGRSHRAGAELPTLLDVVQDEPQHRVSGHLVIRRSRGVVAPGVVHFGSISLGKRRERRIVLTAVDSKPFTVEVDRVPAAFQVDVDSKEPATQQWVTVAWTGEFMGEIDETLLLRTTHPDQSEVRIELKARVQAER